MKARTVLAAFLLAVGLCFVSVPSAGERMLDGYWWNELNAEQKLFFLCGYNEAMEKTYQGFWIGGLVKFIEENPDKLEIIGEDRFRYVKGMYDYYMESEQLAGVQYRQIIEGVDTFYDDFRNKTIDVTDAIRVVVMQLHNEPKETVERLIKGLREGQREGGYEFLEETNEE